MQEGDSSSQNSSPVEVEDEREEHDGHCNAAAVHYKIAQWDTGNGLFFHKPKVAFLSPGSLQSAAVRDSFSLVWRRFDTICTRKYTAQTLDPSDVVPGVIQLQFQTIYAKGEELVGALAAAVEIL